MIKILPQLFIFIGLLVSLPLIWRFQRTINLDYDVSIFNDYDMKYIIEIDDINHTQFIFDKENEILINELYTALQPENRNITLIVTSCNRLDFLQTTISSFLKYYPHSKYPLFEKILIEDCKNLTSNKLLMDLYGDSFHLVFTSSFESNNV